MNLDRNIYLSHIPYIDSKDIHHFQRERERIEVLSKSTAGQINQEFREEIGFFFKINLIAQILPM